MRIFERTRTTLIALMALVGLAMTTGPASADSGTVHLSWIKGGWWVGATVGSGTLGLHGRDYALGVGGITGGFVFGAAYGELWGTVSNVSTAADVAGVYVAAGAGIAALHGPGAIVLTNGRGAVLELHGDQQGLMLNADLSGLILTLR